MNIVYYLIVMDVYDTVELGYSDPLYAVNSPHSIGGNTWSNIRKFDIDFSLVLLIVGIFLSVCITDIVSRWFIKHSL